MVVRRLGMGLVLMAGCLTAALLHIALEFEGEHGLGSGVSTGYSHILVMPLLFGALFGTGTLLVRRVLRGWSAWQRSRLYRSVAVHITTGPVTRIVALTALSALIAFAVNEQCEQLISLGHLDPASPLGTAFSPAFVAQLVAISVGVTTLLKVLLTLGFLAARAVGEALAALFQQICFGSTAEGRESREPDSARVFLRVSTRSKGRRAPPQLLVA